MNHIHLLALLATLGLVGCASKPPAPPKTHDSFITLIKRDGTKQFSYTLIMEMPEAKGKGPGRGHGGPPPGGIGSGGKGPGGKRPEGKGPGGKGPDIRMEDKDDLMAEQFALMFDKGLNEKLATTGFCRTGFNQLDKQSRRGATQVQGECNEPATDEDKQKFPNPPPKKIKVDVLE